MAAGGGTPSPALKVELRDTLRTHALPGVALFWWMARSGLVDRSVGTAGTEGPGDAREGSAA